MPEITAAYARERTDANQQVAIGNILAKIEAAFEAGEEMIQVDILAEHTIAYLHNKGFTVNSMLAVQDMGIKISW